MVPSRIELLILALLAPRLNQLGQGTTCCFVVITVIYTDIIICLSNMRFLIISCKSKNANVKKIRKLYLNIMLTWTRK